MGLIVPEIAKLVDTMDQDVSRTSPSNLSPANQRQLWEALKTPAGYKFLTESRYKQQSGGVLTRDEAFQYMEKFPDKYNMEELNWNF